MSVFDFAEDGIMPVSGGLLEQSDSFLDALAFYRNAKANLQT